MRRSMVRGQAQGRANHIRFCVVIGLILLTAAVFQVSLFARILSRAIPDLMLICVLIIAFFCGRHTGAITGICAGFLIEAIGSVGISLLPLAYLFLGYMVGHYARVVIPKRFVSYLAYLCMALLLRAGLTVTYACLQYQVIDLPQILLHAVLPELLTTAIAGMLLFFPIGWAARRRTHTSGND